jgi:hypothetical protein
MPIYTLNTMGHEINGDTRKSFVKALTALHVQTFHSDPAAVRVEFVIGPGENTRFRYVRAFFSIIIFHLSDLNLSREDMDLNPPKDCSAMK